MMNPAILAYLTSAPADELRQVIAHAAGLHAARDQDGGKLVAVALRRVADRLDNAPRRPAE